MQNTKKINILLLSIYRNGAIRILFEYAKYLSRDGYDVCIYHTLLPYKQSENEGLIKYLKRIKEKFHYLFNNKNYLNKYNLENLKIKLVPFISDFFVRKSDVTIFTYWPIAYKLLKTSAVQGRILYLIQAYEIWDASLKLLHNTYKLGFTNIVTSDFLKNLIKEKADAGSTVILNGIDFEKYKNDTKVFHKEIITIGFIDYRVKFKGTEDIVKALDKIYPDYKSKINILALNDGESFYLRDYINYVNQPDDNAIIDFYCKCDIFISASYEEGFYLVPAEAMACKCANISTNVGALREYSTDGESVLLFEPGDIKSLEEKIRYLLDNTEELEKISLKGYNEVRNKLNWKESIEKIKKLF